MQKNASFCYCTYLLKWPFLLSISYSLFISLRIDYTSQSLGLIFSYLDTYLTKPDSFHKAGHLTFLPCHFNFVIIFYQTVNYVKKVQIADEFKKLNCLFSLSHHLENHSLELEWKMTGKADYILTKFFTLFIYFVIQTRLSRH